MLTKIIINMGDMYEKDIIPFQKNSNNNDDDM